MSNVILIAGLNYGDEGKGTTVDYLARKHEAHTVVRYNGGAQAGHSVVLEDDRHHTFAQFGSATFVPGVKTHLSRHMLINPIFMMSEEKHLRTVGVEDAFERMTIERDALITTPYHVAANRIREMARSNRHGSCGMGIGETVSSHLFHPQEDLRIGDLEGPITARLEQIRARYLWELATLHIPECKFRDYDCICPFKHEWGMLLNKSLLPLIVGLLTGFLKLPLKVVDETYLPLIMGEGTTIFEGAQGVLLDQDYGFHPYTTWSDTTFSNALNLIEGFSGDVRKIGIVRSYMTRHGAGPFVTEDVTLQLPSTKVEHNSLNPWQSNFRVGHFDAFATNYALKVIGGVDEIAMTHCDVPSSGKICVGYRGEFTPEVLQDMPHVKHIREDLDVRTGITNALFNVFPVYLTDVAEKDFIPKIEDFVGTPITIKSYGPTAKDKR